MLHTRCWPTHAMPSRTQAMPHLRCELPLTQSFPRTAAHTTDAAKSTVEEALIIDGDGWSVI